MPLSDIACRSAKPADKAYKLSDERGLHLLVKPEGGRYWRFSYRFDGKQKTLALGVYPDVSLADARERREAARKKVANGIDPSESRKTDKLARLEAVANSFEAVSKEWLSKQKNVLSDDYHKRVFRQLEANIWPWLGKTPVSEIKASDILQCLRRVEKRGATDMANRIRETVSRVMRYAISTGRSEYDPAPSLRGALTPHVTKHMASVTEPSKVGEVLRMFDGFSGTHVVRTALLIAPLLFCRPGELRHMRWADVDTDAGLWSLEAGRMKMRKSHIVPLSKQAVELIEDLRPLTGHCEYVFTGARDPKRPMSNAAINSALRRLGIDTKDELTGHGFRAMARTILRERLKIDTEVIECQLSHTKKGAHGGAYDRTLFLDERIAMMQSWANYLDDLKAGGKVIRLPLTG